MTVALASIRSGIADNLATVTGLKVYAYATGNEQFPAAILLPADPWIERDQAMQRGLVLVNWRVDLLVRMPSTERAQVDLETFIGEVVDGLLSDRTVGTTGCDLKVTSVSGFSLADTSGGDGLAVTIDLTVSAPDA